MYYSASVQTNEELANKGTFRTFVIEEMNEKEFQNFKLNVVQNYIRKEKFHFKGNIVNPNDLRRFEIRLSDRPFSNYYDFAMNSSKRSRDITEDVLAAVKLEMSAECINDSNESKSFSSKRVFIVHGRDDSAKTETARLIEQLGLEAVILHEQTNGGKTIIEKIEDEADCGFAIVLYTPCDLGRFSSESIERSRARQNVVFEHGYLIGRLGRDRVCALKKGDVETPSDISGVVYTDMDKAGMWKMTVARELQAVGFAVDMNKIR